MKRQREKITIGRVIRRKIFHILLGCVFLIFIARMQFLRTPLTLLLFFGALLSFLQSSVNLPIVTWILDRFDRSSDTVPGEGIITFFSGVMLVWWIFPVEVSLLAVGAMTFGDPAASIVGILSESPALPWNAEKTLFGLCSFFLATLAIGTPLVGIIPAIVAAFCSSIIESLPYWRTFPFDDNISVCGLCGLILWLVFYA